MLSYVFNCLMLGLHCAQMEDEWFHIHLMRGRMVGILKTTLNLQFTCKEYYRHRHRRRSCVFIINYKWSIIHTF